jgi:thiol:disulfide interchange protein DsbC
MLKKWFALALFTSGMVAYAADSDDGSGAIKDKLKGAFPEIPVDEVKTSAVPGFFQINSGAEIFYVSQDGKYLFAGNVIDLDSKNNITEEAKNTLRLAEINKLPENAFITFKPEKETKYKVVVFTDIDCPYCRKLHEEIKNYLKQGIEVSYVPFPRAGLGSDSYYKAVHVWCAKNPQKEMDSAKLQHGKFKFKKDMCVNNPVPKSMEAVQAMHLQGTPAIMLPDGTVIPGYVPADNLVKILKEKADKAK